MNLNIIHHIAIICSDKDAALHFYHDLLGFPIIRSTYREDRKDWKIDLRLNDNTELELFIMPNRPMRVSNPEAYGLRYLAFQVSSVEDRTISNRKPMVSTLHRTWTFRLMHE